MLCCDGKVSLISFLGNIVTAVCTSTLVYCYFSLELNSLKNVLLCFVGPVMTYILFCAIGYCVTSQSDFSIIKRAALLGICFGLSTFTLFFAPSGWKRFAIYFMFMSIFHYSEYLTIAWANPRTLSTDTFMLNHSTAYIIAAATSWIEFLIEINFCPWIKENLLILLIGVAMCITGEVLRKLAIITASTNFNHIVQYHKDEGHTLITHGVYRYMRHPSYAGWFWWSIGTQIVLGNPLCVLIYAIVSWKFFHDRILVEEVALVNFFLDKYVEYQQRTPTGVPLVKGYVEGAYDGSSFK